MDPTQLATYRQALQALKDELTAQQDELSGAETVELDQSRVGRLSRMDALQGQQLALERRRRQARRLQAVEGALRRIDSGEFGYCFRCGTPIAEARLNADPTLTRCLDCVDEDD